jgi:methyltransferase of ATP-grasp peptide maturase system
VTITPVIDDWRQRAEGLADQLAALGVLHDPAWRAAVCGVPRHVLVPHYYQQHGSTTQWQEVSGSDYRQREQWLTAIYSNTAVFTALAANDRGRAVGVSSTSQPSLMIRMLEALDVHEGMRVLEIGTGTGYNAALLAHRLGDGNVFSLDIDPELVNLARQRLASVGRHPCLAVLDGIDGWPAHIPYDRIIATCSVPRVPWKWAEQLTPDGLLLADLKAGTMAGNLVLLHRDTDRLEGRFLPKWAGFMPMRHHGQTPLPRQPKAPLAQQRYTPVPACPWTDNSVVWFLASLALPRGVRHGFTLDPRSRTPKAASVSAPDGSWCEVAMSVDDGGRRTVREGGPTQLWTEVEDAYRRFHDWSQPGWDRFGVTVTADQHKVWLDEPDNTVTALGVAPHI